jgi:nicotinamide-nucleotide amidase
LTKAIILTIGDELLNGQTINTNQAWMAQRLNEAGVAVVRMLTIGDSETLIINAVQETWAQADIVLLTGGLGPTTDDITRDCLCKVFGAELVFDQKVYNNIVSLYSRRGRPMFPEAEDLARVPHNCKVIYNTTGTAPGMLFHKAGKMLASMPGVPYEMEAMITQDVLPFIRENFSTDIILHKHILTAGVGETILAEKIKLLAQQLPGNISLAYLPSLGKVKLRLTATGRDAATTQQLLDTTWPAYAAAIEEHVYGYDEDRFEAVIGELLLQKGLWLGTAESCTGGYLSHLITSIAGSSRYFRGGIVSYDNAVKIDVLGVQEDPLQQHGAVSEQVVSDMLDGALRVLDADVAVAVSGVAGPGGGSEEKPVGTVYIGVGNRENKVIKRLQLMKHRQRNIELSSVIALVMLWRFLQGKVRAGMISDV